jgi:hypothetical protein
MQAPAPEELEYAPAMGRVYLLEVMQIGVLVDPARPRKKMRCLIRSMSSQASWAIGERSANQQIGVSTGRLWMLSVLWQLHRERFTVRAGVVLP